MLLPIILYGNKSLRKQCTNINIQKYKKEYMDELIHNMFYTVKKMNGIGLAAPQIGKNIKLFIVEIPCFNGNKINKYKEVFINAKIKKTYGYKYIFNEGCLSIPGINVNIKRKSKIIIEYYDQNLVKKEKKLTGLYARVILHEYDHLFGILFIDYLSKKDKKLINKQLNYIINK